MVFSSFSFLFIFLPTLLCLYYLVPSRYRQARNNILLLFSLAFYACGGAKFLLLMLASVLINYIGGIAAGKKRFRRFPVVIAVIVNLALLGWFKYAGFLAEVVNAVGIMLPIPQITLPIGISFYTFQGLSYVIDVERGDTAPQRNILKLALYISLFPQLIAGPIVRYSDIADEIDKNRESRKNFSDGIVRFSVGLAKKLLLANTFGKIADGIFLSDPRILSCADSWVGALAYAGQIFFDFAGYSDMAIGLGKMFGFHFSENFNYPYISRSVTEFWRRWHISLSTWFRDYVYIPLGGSRTTPLKHVRNILIVWLLTGLWHGAAWNFVFWGLWYGFLLLGEKFVWKKLLDKTPSVIRWMYTMLIVLVGWVLFRSESFDGILTMLRTMFGFGVGVGQGQAVYYLIEYLPEWIVGILACMPIVPWLKNRLSEDGFGRIWAVKAFAGVLLILSYASLITGTFNPFLYFRF